MVDALDEDKVSDQIDRAASATAHAAGALCAHFDFIRAIGAAARGKA